MENIKMENENGQPVLQNDTVTADDVIIGSSGYIDLKFDNYGFKKVSYETFLASWQDIYDEISNEEVIRKIYDNIKLPERATSGSMGFDFYSPFDLKLLRDSSIIIPTGIKCLMKKDQGLIIAPRSGSGFKYRLGIANTIGIIDSDYYNNHTNEGHIMIKLVYNGFGFETVIKTNNGEIEFEDNPKSNKPYIEFKSGEAIAQGFIVKYDTFGDEVSTIRDGGMGSTTNKDTNN